MLNPVSYLVCADGIHSDANGTTELYGTDTPLFAHGVAGEDVFVTQPIAYGCMGIDLESFRHEIENGVDTSSKALPMSLELTQGGTAVHFASATIQVFVMFDALFYVNMDGTISISS